MSKPLRRLGATTNVSWAPSQGLSWLFQYVFSADDIVPGVTGSVFAVVATAMTRVGNRLGLDASGHYDWSYASGWQFTTRQGLVVVSTPPRLLPPAAKAWTLQFEANQVNRPTPTVELVLYGA